MKTDEAMQRLESLGTAQNRKVYARHGVTGKVFGVSYADLAKLERTIKTDHALAKSLWRTGNHDARVLATKIADPAELSAAELESWAKACRNYVVTDALVALACRSEKAQALTKKWIRSKDEWIGTAGWSMIPHRHRVGEDLDEAFMADCIDTLEARIHSAPNRTRYAMNNALISIGCASPALRNKAVAAARRIGKVEVDHGETGCKTPDAASYIDKVLAHRKSKLRKKA